MIGHRGCGGTKFSNTIEAFLKAAQLGAEMIEFDVRRSQDGVLIVHHDSDVFGSFVSENSCADLKRIALAEGLVLSTLEETLIALRGKVQLDVELKESGYEKDVVNLVLKYFSTSEFIMKSFHDESVLAIKKSFPDVSAGLLIGTNDELTFDAHVKSLRKLKRKYHEIFPWKRVKNCRADFISPDRRLLFLGMLRSAARRRIPVLVWTVNDRRTMVALRKTGLVSGIITDLPETK